MGRLFATFAVLSAICTVSTSKAGELKIFKRTVWPESSPISNMENWLTPNPTASWECELWGAAAKTEAEQNSQAEETDALALLENLDLENAQEKQVVESKVLGNINIEEDEAHLKKYMSDNDVQRMLRERAQKERQLRQMRLELKKRLGLSSARPQGSAFMFGGMVAPTTRGSIHFGQGAKRKTD